MKIFSNKYIILLLISAFFLTSGLSCKLFPGNSAPASYTKPIELSFWGVWDTNNDLQVLINDFQTLHPNIKITYKKFRYREYEQQLLEAWAEDRGPDIYSIPATWLKKYQAKITPMPDSTKLSFQEVKTTLGKTEINTYVRDVPTYSARDIKNEYVDVVYNDVILNGRIYGLPLSMDTLVMYYNRDLLDASDVPTPPTNWTELKEAVKKITQVNKNNQILQAGVALGTTDNLPHAVDIASLLMIQNGTQMVDAQGRVAFHTSPTKDKANAPGYQALQFYLDFADPIKEVYSWNEDQADAFSAFVAGKLAMFFGYSYHLPLIKNQAPKLDLGIAPMTQIQGSQKAINYTDYWVYTVSRKTKSADAAWGFLAFASRDNEVTKYLTQTKKATALRSLITSQKADPDLATFADQVLTATHWYHGNDVLKMDEYFKEMLNKLPEAIEPAEIIEQAALKINQTL